MNIKYNTKQRYKSIQGLRSFKDTLPREAKRILNKKGDVYNKTLDNWKYIVGKELFKECYPKSFKGSNKVKNSCLTIMVKRGSEVNLEYSKNEIIKKKFPFDKNLEDIHMNIEKRLFDLVGEDAGFIHTARSRNDQVITDFKIWLKKSTYEITKTLDALISTVLKVADKNIKTVNTNNQSNKLPS